MGHLVGRIANVGHIDQVGSIDQLFHIDKLGRAGGGGGEREQGGFKKSAEQAPSVGIQSHFSASNGTVGQGDHWSGF